jgi:hypothetical protein
MWNSLHHRLQTGRSQVSAAQGVTQIHRPDHEAVFAVVLKDQVMTIRLNRELIATVLTQIVSATTRLFCCFTRPFTTAKVYDDE